jgi:pilus assembly protein Flp/PilA
MPGGDNDFLQALFPAGSGWGGTAKKGPSQGNHVVKQQPSRRIPMSKIVNAIVNFIRDEEGTEMVEWGLIAGLIIVVAAAIFAAIGQDLNTIFGGVQVQTAAGAAAVP